MVDPCCGNCSKVYWSISSKNKQRHWSENNINRAISFSEETKLFYCQTAGCAAIAKYKYKIVKHLMLTCQQESKKSSGWQNLKGFWKRKFSIINRKVKEEWTASENYSDPYGHFLCTGEKVLEGFYPKLVQSKNASKKK